MKKVFLTFDIEDWYHSNWRSLRGNFDKSHSNIDLEIDKIIEICDSVNVKSTCFILGSLAKDNPKIVRKLHSAGHEIASHGYNHKLVYEMTPKEFYTDTNKSIQILQDITGEKVYGFRAPSWSVKADIIDWFYDQLLSLGIKYSSSVYPASTYLYGMPNALKKAHIVNCNGGIVTEIPVPITKFLWKTVGYSGGFYLRFFPTWFIKRCIDNASSDSFIYLHPRELNKKQQKLDLNLLEAFIAYYGIRFCEKKLINLVDYSKDRIILMKDYELNVDLND